MKRQYLLLSLCFSFFCIAFAQTTKLLKTDHAASSVQSASKKNSEQKAEKSQQKSPKDDQHQAMKIALGTALFFDVNLSKNRTMSCATCHDPATAFVDLRNKVPGNMASLGDDGTSVGDRNTPSAAYAQFFPDFQKNTGKNREKSHFIGGQFLDGREADLAGQAGGPPINPIEMGMPDKASVVDRILENESYVSQFKSLYGEDVFSNKDHAYRAMTEVIAEFEKTELFAPFDSKYDRFLRGEYELTVLEDLGRSLFFSNNNTNCATCHVLKAEDAEQEVFSNFEYRNIGVPENTALRQLNGETKKDLGLAQNPVAKSDESTIGQFKVPTLRNVAVTGPYMHNGVFKDLKTVVEFYDQYNNPERKLNPETGKPWRDPEVVDNLALDELASKKLTDRKVDALVAFMKTLTDKRYEALLEAQEKQVENRIANSR